MNFRSSQECLNKINFPQFKTNNVVFIKHDNALRIFYSLGRVIETYHGRDGKVKAWLLRTDITIIKRPIQLLYNF